MGLKHLILLHGALGSAEQLSVLQNRLQEHYIVHTLNFPGHGGAAMDGYEFSINGFTAALKDFVERNNIPQPNLFGYSMGGFVALVAAAKKLFTSDKIITLATKFAWTEQIAEKEVRMLDADTLQTKLPAFVDTLAKRHAPQPWREHLSLTANLMTTLGKGHALTEATLANIEQTCLLLLGDQDKMVTEQETMAVQQSLPNGKFQALKDTPHPIEKVDTDLLIAAIRNFLQ